MHECPICGQVCNCNGDIDDSYVMSQEWINVNCDCCYEGSGLDELDDLLEDFDDDFPLDGCDQNLDDKRQMK